jgi:hypothetical protein
MEHRAKRHERILYDLQQLDSSPLLTPYFCEIHSDILRSTRWYLKSSLQFISSRQKSVCIYHFHEACHFLDLVVLIIQLLTFWTLSIILIRI